MSSEFDEHARNLGRAITVRRAAAGMSRKELAAASDVSYPHLAAIEKGDRQPSSKVLLALADALGCSISALMQLSETLPEATSSHSGWTLTTNRSPIEAYASTSFGDDSGLIDELRDELSLMRRRLDRLDSEVRELRYELQRRDAQD